MKITDYIEDQQEWVSGFLMKLISLPSVSGNEQEIGRFLYENLREFADEIACIEIDDEILDDEEYSDIVHGNSFQGRYNLRIVKRGRGEGKVFLNSHMDVVPPSAGHIRPFCPVLKDGRIYGRGACDAKGQIAVMALILKALHEALPIGPDVIFHMVIEEETGGNGTLGMLRKEQEKADLAIVMEPSELNIAGTCRGAVWFQLMFSGTSAHAGSQEATENVIYKAMRAVEILKEYHEGLFAKSRDYGPYRSEANPMSFTVGKFWSGDWASMVPGQAEIAGVQGFLPNIGREQVMQGMEERLEREFGCLSDAGISLKFNYRHDAIEMQAGEPFIEAFQRAGEDAGYPVGSKAFTASCDAVYYRMLKATPAVIFGPGSLSLAHTKSEYIQEADLLKAAKILGIFLEKYFSRKRAEDERY